MEFSITFFAAPQSQRGRSNGIPTENAQEAGLPRRPDGLLAMTLRVFFVKYTTAAYCVIARRIQGIRRGNPALFS